MNTWISSLFSTNFEPHYVHFIDNPGLMWFIIIGNGIIAVAYFSIPIALAYFVSKRKDIPFNSIFWMFSAFIFLCGVTHFLHILIFWYPMYNLQAVIDFITGLVSIGTAIALWYLMPFFLKIPSIKTIREKNRQLQEEIIKRQQAEDEINKLNKSLEGKVKERTKDLEQSERRFTALYKSNLLGVLTAEFAGRILDANDAFLNMTGYSRKELEDGKLYWNKLTPKEYIDRDTKAIEELKETGYSHPYEKEYIRKDGSQIPILVGRALLDSKKGQYIAFVLDITERKRLEQRKDEFIGIASHELKTPLTSVKGYIQILERIVKEMGHEKAKLYITKTNIYVRRLNSLIEELLDVSKIQAGKLQLNKEYFDIHDLLNDSIEGVQLASTSHKIQFKGRVVHQRLYGDKHRLEQVMTNLLNNAIKYSPGADKIVVSVKNKQNEVVVSIQDFGIGIQKNKQSKLFSRFYRIVESQKFSGLGIGLFISCEIVQRHGGRMWVDSDLGKGSTFYFSLPHPDKK